MPVFINQCRMLRERKWAVMAGRKSTKPAAKAAEVAEVEAIEPKAEEIKTEEIAEPKKEETQKEETKKAPGRKAKGTKAEAPKEEAPKAEEAAEAAKEDVKAEAPKTKGRKAGAVKKEAKEAAAVKAPAKKETVKKPVEKCALHIQYAGRSYAQEDLVKIAKDVWKYDLKRKAGELETIELYVKPEENKVYYVMNGEVTGNFDI